MGNMCQQRDDRKQSLNSKTCCTNLCNVMNILKSILIDLGIPEASLRNNTLLYKDLQLDSVEIVEIALGLKRKLGVNVKLETGQDMTLAEVCHIVTRAIASPPKSTEVKGLGIDIVPIESIAKLVDQSDRQSLGLLFTPKEIDFCQSKSDFYQDYAICFATKEAVGKALGTGLVGIDWNEIEANITSKKVTIHLSGKAGDRAKKRGVQSWLANWYDWDKHILVQAIAL